MNLKYTFCFQLICPISNAFKCIKDTNPAPFNIDKSDLIPSSTSGPIMKAKLDAAYLPGDFVRCKVIFKDIENDCCEVKMYDRGSEEEDLQLGLIKSSDLPAHYRNM